MLQLLAQEKLPDVDWGNLIYVLFAVLAGLGEAIRRWATRKHGPIDAEIEEDVPPTPQPARPVARPPRPTQSAPARPVPPRSVPGRPQVGSAQRTTTASPPTRPAAPGQFAPPSSRPASAQRPQPFPARPAPIAPGLGRPQPPAAPSQLAVDIAEALHRAKSSMTEPRPETPEEPPAAAAAAPRRVATDPASLRQAIILNEILAPPLALRQQGISPYGPLT